MVADLGFGDAGKGLLVDHLVRSTGARTVVRYNGGAQAGHNVVALDGRHHTFAQLGAGSFVAGVRTFLSRHVTVHPTALLEEMAVLAGKGVVGLGERLRISERALLVTPYHQAAGRLRELARGAACHGTCGVGVGEAVADALARPDEALRAGDLRDGRRLRRLVARIGERKRAEVEALWPLSSPAPSARVERERRAFDDPGLAARWQAAAVRLHGLGLVAPDATLAAWLGKESAAVFEGAQGVLLDERAGFHPHTTWSRCTFDNALELLAEAAPAAEVRRIGVLRSHAVRHGPGPLPTEAPELAGAVVEHNRHDEWQGAVRYGWFDAVLARYALAVAGPVEALAVTHLDAPARAGRWRLCAAYDVAAAAAGGDGDGLVAARDAAGRATALAPPAGRCLERQARLTALLRQAVPALEECEPTAAAALAAVERLLGRRVDLVSAGPRAADVRSLTRRGARRR